MVNFKAGKYYVGDLCYVINETNWDELLDTTNYFEGGSFIFKDKEGFVANTAYGDGRYYDDEGREYCVDAGLIGVIPFEIIDDNFEGKGGQIIEFTHDFNAYEENGTFFIDDFEICTKEEEEEEIYIDEDEEDYEDEELDDDEE